MKFMAIATLIGLLVPSLTWAAKIKTVKDKSVIIELEGENPAVGSYVFALNEQKVKVGVIQINKVAAGTALGTLSKGTATLGNTIQIAATLPPSSSANPASTPKPAPHSIANSRNWGLLLGFASNTMKVSVAQGSSKEEVTLKGTSTPIQFFYEKRLFSSIFLHGGFTILKYSVKGNSQTVKCDGSNSCYFDVDYMGADLLGKYYLSEKSFATYIFGGVDILSSSSIKTNVIESKSASTQTLAKFGFGADIKMSRTSYMPIHIDYGAFPKASGIAADILIVSIGWGSSF